MDIKVRTRNGIGLIVLTGDLRPENGRTDPCGLRTVIARILGRGARDVVVELSGVPGVDACGIGELVLAFNTVRQGRGRLQLVAPTARVAQALAVTRVDTVIGVRGSVTEAVADAANPDVMGDTRYRAVDPHTTRAAHQEGV